MANDSNGDELAAAAASAATAADDDDETGKASGRLSIRLRFSSALWEYSIMSRREKRLLADDADRALTRLGADTADCHCCISCSIDSHEGFIPGNRRTAKKKELVYFNLN